MTTFPLSPRLRRITATLAWLLPTLLAGTQTLAADKPAPACPPTATMPTPAQVNAGMLRARDRGFLWRITKDDRVSYLYGTIHIAKADWIYPGPTLVKAAQSVDAIALEMDLQDADIVQRFQAALAASPKPTLPEGMTLRLQAQMAKECLPAQVAQAMSPEMLVNTLIVLSARRDGLDPGYGIDAVYGGMARGLKKPAYSLETPEAQLKLLQGDTPEDTIRMVEQALQGLEGPEVRAMMTRLGRMWAESRFDELARYEEWCDCTKTEFDRAMLKRMLDDRNPALADKIDAMHASGQRVFAAVGSLHMIGSTGLPTLMAQRGYQVERVDFAR